MAMASLAETRDNETGNHIRRTQAYIEALARRLQAHPRFAALFTDANIELLFKSVPLHDIGKVGVPDRILLKPGKLDADEFEIMKLHTVYGRDAIPASARLMAVADVYDALISQRVYKPAFSHDEAVRMMRERRGKHFDPDILDAFLAIEEHFRAIARCYRDDGDDSDDDGAP